MPAFFVQGSVGLTSTILTLLARKSIEFGEISYATCDFLLVSILQTYTVFRIVSKLLQIIGHFLQSIGIPLFNTFIRGEILKSGLRNLTSVN